MRIMRTLFLLIIFSLAFVGCTSYDDELVNINEATARSVTASTLRVNPNYVATALEGPYENADCYLMMSTGHYLVSDHFYLRCIIKNNGENNIVFQPSLMSISLGNSTVKIPITLKDLDKGTLMSAPIPANGSITAYFELPSSFMDERIDINIPQMKPSLYHVTNIHFYYNGYEQECSLYNFLFSTHAEQNRN
ncbi:hypothetical protein [Phocaeicola sp.]